MKLRDYQEKISSEASALLMRYKIAYLAMECRTGKTLTALAAANKYGAKSVLLVTKLKAIPSIKSDYALLAPSFSMEVTNYESVHKCAGKFDLVILDEAHSLGAFPKPSQRTRAVKAVCGGLPIVYLSGTPSPESYSQLYHQFWVSSFSPFATFPNFYKWANAFVEKRQKKVNGNMLNDYSVARKDKIDACVKKYFIDYSQEEAGFDANIEEHTVVVPVSQWTKRAIAQLQRDKILQWNDTVVLGDTPAKMLSKMHQLSSGSVIDEAGQHIVTDPSKALAIRDMFHGKRKAIFYVYQSELDLLRETFPNYTLVPEEFQQSADSEMVFIGQVRSVREGVRLDKADVLLFFNLEYSYLSYEQGRNRLASKERTSPAVVYFICSDCGIESDILDAVHGKQDFTLSYYKHKHG